MKKSHNAEFFANLRFILDGFLCRALVAVGTVVTLICVFFAVNTVSCGFPACAGKGFVLFSSGGALGLPDDDLIIFDPCDADDLRTGDYCVYRSASGPDIGVVKSAGEDKIVLTKDAEGKTATVITRALVIGRAHSHNPSASKAISAVASVKTELTAISAAIVIFELTTLMRKNKREFLSAD